MPNSKISALTGATTPLAGTEELPIVQSGATKKVSVANLTAGRSISALSATITNDLTISTGNLVIGTSGKGIDFSATPGTGTSELLADYEEGAWTPTLNPAAGTITGQTTSGTYIKVGKMVLCQFRVLITGGTVTNIASISGFPFTAENANPTAGGICRENTVTGLTWNVVGISNATTFDLIRYDATNFCANGYGWAGSIVYRTAS